jgi:hypothetical protein
VEAHDWASWHHTIRHITTTRRPLVGPHTSQHTFPHQQLYPINNPCHPTMRQYGFHSQPVRTVQSTFYFHVWKRRMNMISLT